MDSFAKLLIALCLSGILCQLVLSAPAKTTEATVPLSVLVPRVSPDSFYSLDPNENSYYLRIEQPDGSYRHETVTFTDADGLSVSGDVNTMFEEGTLWVRYEAGKQGYVAKVSFVQGRPMPAKPSFASSTFLKTAAG